MFYDISSTDSEVLSTFELTRSTGILTTIDTLDADSPPIQYVFNISAEDSSSSPHTTLVSVTISITGINDNTPVRVIIPLICSIYCSSSVKSDYDSLLTIILSDRIEYN